MALPRGGGLGGGGVGLALEFVLSPPDEASDDPRCDGPLF